MVSKAKEEQEEQDRSRIPQNKQEALSSIFFLAFFASVYRPPRDTFRFALFVVYFFVCFVVIVFWFLQMTDPWQREMLVFLTILYIHDELKTIKAESKHNGEPSRCLRELRPSCARGGYDDCPRGLVGNFGVGTRDPRREKKKMKKITLVFVLLVSHFEF